MDVVDVARIALIESARPEGDPGSDRDVDHSFELAAGAAVGNLVDLSIHAPGQHAELRLVGDDADRARFAGSSVQRALRSREALDPRNVVDMDVERSADGRPRLLV